ncbi:MAG: response regulator [Nitrospirae bacterium]|nr:response regulator [Nitrospirota bacterium]
MSTHKILIVEDNPVNMELFIDLLGLCDYECLCAEEGQSALELAKSGKPDLILLDIQLPGMDGLSVASELRANEETRHIKIIAVTAYAMKGEKDIFLEKGFDGYISKPIDNKDFLSAVKGFLEG